MIQGVLKVNDYGALHWLVHLTLLKLLLLATEYTILAIKYLHYKFIKISCYYWDFQWGLENEILRKFVIPVPVDQTPQHICECVYI